MAATYYRSKRIRQPPRGKNRSAHTRSDAHVLINDTALYTTSSLQYVLALNLRCVSVQHMMIELVISFSQLISKVGSPFSPTDLHLQRLLPPTRVMAMATNVDIATTNNTVHFTHRIFLAYPLCLIPTIVWSSFTISHNNTVVTITA